MAPRGDRGDGGRASCRRRLERYLLDALDPSVYRPANQGGQLHGRTIDARREDRESGATSVQGDEAAKKARRFRGGPQNGDESAPCAHGGGQCS